MKTIKKQKNFNVSKETLDKLAQIRNYHNKTYDSLFELLVNNAFLHMSENVNLNKGKELEEQNLKVGFQVQQLTLMFAELKKELAEVRTENLNLIKTIDELKLEDKQLNEELQAQEVKNKGRSEKYAGEIKVLNKWVSEKDKNFLSKLLG